MRPRLKVLQDNLIAQILFEAKQILSQVGIEVRGPQLRRRLLDYGLRQEPTTGRVLFPHEVVDKAIATTPRSFSLYKRNGEFHTELGGDKVHFVPGSSGLRVLDHRTGQVRLANTTDFVEYVRVCDGLPHIAYLATAFSTNDDIEASVSDAWRLYLCLTNSLRPVVSGAFTEHGVPRMAEMMLIFRRDKADLMARPMSIFTITATGMFRYSEDSCQNLLDCVEWGIPIEVVPVTLMGLIAPVTLVGATVMHVADVLAGLTMAQIVRPGAPVLFGGAPAAFHMKLASSPMAAIEALHLDVAYAAVAGSLGLPTQAYMALSEAKMMDAQAGAETFGSALLAALAGINSVSGPGMLDYLLVFSLEKLIFDDDMCGQALHFVREMKSLEDIPTVDLVRRLLEEQHLLTDPHTLKYWPGELYLPNPIIDRFTRENWLKMGQPTLQQRAHDDVERRLAAYIPTETEPQAEAELQRLIRSGMTGDRPLPEIPPPVTRPDLATAPDRRERRRRRG
jgi:trimethylamine--corrinoid protein Co-methyltransferase